MFLADFVHSINIVVTRCEHVGCCRCFFSDTPSNFLYVLAHAEIKETSLHIICIKQHPIFSMGTVRQVMAGNGFKELKFIGTLVVSVRVCARP